MDDLIQPRSPRDGDEPDWDGLFALLNELPHLADEL